MTMYAKLIDKDNIEFAPRNKGAILNYDVNVEAMTADGYKPFVEVDRPETTRFYHVEYDETADSVEEIVVYDETQEEADEREHQAEQDRVNHLTMTALDFLKVLYSMGLTRKQVHDYLESHPEVDEELKYCQSVYCGVVKQLCPIKVDDITITANMIEQAFKNKYLV